MRLPLGTNRSSRSPEVAFGEIYGASNDTAIPLGAVTGWHMLCLSIIFSILRLRRATPPRPSFISLPLRAKTRRASPGIGASPPPNTRTGTSLNQGSDVLHALNTKSKCGGDQSPSMKERAEIGGCNGQLATAVGDARGQCPWAARSRERKPPISRARARGGGRGVHGVEGFPLKSSPT